MLAIKGIYDKGKVILQETVKTKKPVEVVITFLEELQAPTSEKLDLNKFSFERARELLKDYDGSLSEAIIEERRSAI